MFIILYNFFFGHSQIFEIVLFFFLNVLIINCLMSFFVKNPVYSLLYLIMNYFIAGFIFVLNNLVFLGLTFMLIYVGAVSILLLFTFMLLNIKVIYFNNFKKKHLLLIIYLVFIIEFFIFFIFFINYEVLHYESSFFINWLEIYNIKNDLNVVSIKMYFENAPLVFLCSMLLLMSLLASVNIVNSLKSSKKQKAYMQIKNYRCVLTK